MQTTQITCWRLGFTSLALEHNALCITHIMYIIDIHYYLFPYGSIIWILISLYYKILVISIAIFDISF